MCTVRVHRPAHSASVRMHPCRQTAAKWIRKQHGITPAESRSWLGREVPEVSRFSCMLFLDVRGFLDYAEPADHSRLTQSAVLPFPSGMESASLIKSLFEAQ